MTGGSQLRNNDHCGATMSHVKNATEMSVYSEEYTFPLLFLFWRVVGWRWASHSATLHCFRYVLYIFWLDHSLSLLAEWGFSLSCKDLMAMSRPQTYPVLTWERYRHSCGYKIHSTSWMPGRCNIHNFAVHDWHLVPHGGIIKCWKSLWRRDIWISLDVSV
jgi:hypothetical protein